jgi:spore maturation protein CgeB
MGNIIFIANYTKQTPQTNFGFNDFKYILMETKSSEDNLQKSKYILDGYLLYFLQEYVKKQIMNIWMFLFSNISCNTYVRSKIDQEFNPSIVYIANVEHHKRVTDAYRYYKYFCKLSSDDFVSMENWWHWHQVTDISYAFWALHTCLSCQN